MIEIHIKQKRIFIPLLPILPLILIMEIIAIIPITIYALIKKEAMLFRIAYGFYFSRLIIALIFYGKGLKIVTGEVTITGEHISELLYFRSKSEKVSYLT